MVWRFTVNVAHEFWQSGVSQHLPDGQVLAGVIPIMIDHSLEHRSEAGGAGLAVPDHVILQLLRGHRVQPRIDGSGYGVPRLPHVNQRRRTGGSSVGEHLVDLREQEGFALRVEQEVPLLLPGQVPDVPTDAVHGHQPLARLIIAQVFQCALEFAAGKAQLLYEWMVRHTFSPQEIT